MPGPPSILLTGMDLLPDQGRALDIAGGNGRHALWLAERGLSVTLLDVSAVALEQAAAAARAASLPLETVRADLERDPLPAGPWDLILSFHYLNRDLWPRFPELLAPGGILVFVQPTRRNLERHERPGADFLLEEGEAARIAGGLEVVRLEEDWSAEGRHEALLVARRPRVSRARPGPPSSSPPSDITDVTTLVGGHFDGAEIVDGAVPYIALGRVDVWDLP